MRGRGGGSVGGEEQTHELRHAQATELPIAAEEGIRGIDNVSPWIVEEGRPSRHGRIEDADDDAIDDDIDGGCWDVVVAVAAEDLHPSLSEWCPWRPRRLCMVGLLSLSWVKSDRSPGSSGIIISTSLRAMFGSVGGSW